MIINNKNLNNLNDIDYSEGVTILMNKPLNITSFKLVSTIKKISGAKKVGHAGTLDPKATGLMILCTGKKTKEITNLITETKEYKGTFILGSKTKSFDSETEIYESNDISKLSEIEIINASKIFLGQINQIPPMFSAVKVNGKRLYKYAHKGKEIQRMPRNVYVEYFNLTKFDLPVVEFELSCSKGTYVRSIINDLGENLKVGAYLSSLIRTKIGNFNINDALNIEDFELKYNKVN